MENVFVKLITVLLGSVIPQLAVTNALMVIIKNLVLTLNVCHVVSNIVKYVTKRHTQEYVGNVWLLID